LYDYLYSIIIYPLFYIFSAYAANGAPVLFGGRKPPLDFGKKFMGKRIFGDSKSVYGTASGILCGIIVGIAEYHFIHYMLYVAIALTFGAVFGDLFGSFLKRQAGIKPGHSVLLLDQYGFLAFALLFALPLGNLPSAYGLLFLVLLTGPLHLLTNVCANMLRLKKVPW
jgi:CDP-2,3-bis-(O-geranylgeranyl)-sn-glycerol synthase